MATRTTYKSSTPGAVAGDDLMDNVSAHIATMYTGLPLPLTSIGGTADAVTATVDPVLDNGLIAGMSFQFTAAATNTGAMTMTIGSESAVDMVTPAGAALTAGEVVSGTTYQLYFDGTDLQVRERTATGSSGASVTYDLFTSSGTLTKPTGFPDAGLVIMELWGGGGGGDSAAQAGGGGGGYNRGIFRGADLGATESVTVGAGGAADTVGGNSSVGSLVTAYGGGQGGTTGGGGGGQLSAGQAGDLGGAAGHPRLGTSTAGYGGAAAVGQDNLYGGGGGGDDTNDGGDSLFGGAGGGGGNGGSGGSSVHGGNGGADGVAGSVPGGGGGGNGASGARGEVRVRWIG